VARLSFRNQASFAQFSSLELFRPSWSVTVPTPPPSHGSSFSCPSRLPNPPTAFAFCLRATVLRSPCSSQCPWPGAAPRWPRNALFRGVPGSGSGVLRGGFWGVPGLFRVHQSPSKQPLSVVLSALLIPPPPLPPPGDMRWCVLCQNKLLRLAPKNRVRARSAFLFVGVLVVVGVCFILLSKPGDMRWCVLCQNELLRLAPKSRGEKMISWFL
jgi:hypothetical protein